MFAGSEKCAEAVAEGRLMESAAANIATLLQGAKPELYPRVVAELIASNEWSELNDRFYQTLAFGTGGLRGRTIGKVLTAAERGQPDALGRPEFPCVGTNAMNFYNVSRATQGLVGYLKEWFRNEGIAGKPKLVIAHDTRFFSPEFTALAAQIAADNGCDAFIFDGPRSTPQLSFTVRQLEASAGIVITASHNPPHDNGYKVYFRDGAQVVEPHASGIIRQVNAVGGTDTGPSSDAPAGIPPARGAITTLGVEVDRAYMERLETLILDPAMVQSQRGLRIVFTPIHGTGGVIIKPMLRKLGFHFTTVSAQDQFDGRFPTVASPNPENAEALRLGLEQAAQEEADLVVATDPDCDRVGVAVRAQNGEMKLLTGNQIGSLIAYYRAKTLFDQGILNRENAARGVIIKTFVTTDLQKAIAEHYGLRCVETLTGFKYIGAKLAKYERALPAAVGSNYRAMSEKETRALRLQHSSFYIFGGEESYGYSGADFVRDKDGNGAAIMFCEVAAYARSRGLTVDALLDEVYSTFGYYLEKNGAMTFEGAEGADKIKRLLQSYVTAPPVEMLGSSVVAVKNFETETFRDVEGDPIPKEKMLIFELADRTRVAVRGSGTEPKIKYYLFAQRRPEGGPLSATDLLRAKDEVSQHLERLWSWLQEDAGTRLNAVPA
ncbi:MAG TPA: phospho-sugar mutase [Chthoniobacterales bacterium]|nr:phospho-sugar mutase [Chthoniobacterales bacterium]